MPRTWSITCSRTFRSVNFVLTLPPRLRYLLAWDHTLCRAVVAVSLRAVLGWLRRQAKNRGVMGGRGGAVAVVQRFGAALNLNVHIHALVLDGVFAPDGGGGVSFQAHDRHDDDAGPLLVTIERRTEALLHRRGVPDGRDGFDAPDPPPMGRWHARQQGFNLHAGIVVPAGSRDRLERLCRYALPPQRAGKRAPGAPGCGRRSGRTGCN